MQGILHASSFAIINLPVTANYIMHIIGLQSSLGLQAYVFKPPGARIFFWGG